MKPPIDWEKVFMVWSSAVGWGTIAGWIINLLALFFPGTPLLGISFSTVTNTLLVTTVLVAVVIAIGGFPKEDT